MSRIIFAILCFLAAVKKRGSERTHGGQRDKEGFIHSFIHSDSFLFARNISLNSSALKNFTV